MKHLFSLVVVGAIGAALTVVAPRSRVFSAALRGGSAATSQTLPGPIDDVWFEPINRNYSYGPAINERSLRSAGAATASFVITYDSGFNGNPQAQAAFQAAANIWATVVSSPVPIRVSASFRDLGNPRLLGSAGPTYICTSALGQRNTYYANALADKLAGADTCGTGASEIGANFNSAFSAWEYGVAGVPVPGKVSFLTVVLHELGHGLGFYGSLTSSGGIGSWGEGAGVPDIYDRFAFTASGAGAFLLSFPSPSAALGAELVSGNIYFGGSNAIAANGGRSPKLESSIQPFSPGSSYSHIDDALYSGTPNGLMTWQLASAEVYTDPGPIVRGIFADEGWTVQSPTSPTPTSLPGVPTGFTATAFGSGVSLAWTPSTAGGSPTTYVVEAGSNAGGANLANFSTGNTSTSYTTSGVGAGIYYVRVRASNASGVSAPSNEAVLVVGGGCSAAPGAPGTLIGSSTGSTVSLAWSASSGSPTTYVVEAGTSPGLSNIANSDLGSSTPALVAPNISRGLYFIRVRGKNSCGVGPVSNEVAVIVQ